MGRQTTYTQEVADEICARLSKGEPLAQICRDAHMPTDRTVRNWQMNDPDFASAIARAREDGFDAIAAEALSIMDADPERVVSEGSSRIDPAYVQWAKNRAELRLKLLAKWDPKRYGDKLDLSSSDGTMSPKPTVVEFIAPDFGDDMEHEGEC